jgi:hypothetical protein
MSPAVWWMLWYGFVVEAIWLKPVERKQAKRDGNEP